MTPQNVLDFYSRAHWGSGYGVIDKWHTSPHKGLDVALFHGTVEVPALHAGTVVAVAASTSVGHYVTIERPDGLYDTYCHIVPGVSDGQAVSEGENLGRQAVTQAEGGKQWAGQHTHLCLSNTPTGWSTWGHANLDPTPGVEAVLAGSSVPAPPSSAPTSHGWSVGETDFKGTYGENNLDGAKWYCLEPSTGPSSTIWGVANRYGLTLEQVAEWTAKVAASKWAGQLLQAGSSWWDGSGKYYAGVCFALNDVAAALDSYEAQQLAAHPVDPAPSSASPAPASQPAPAPTTTKAPAAPRITQAELDKAVEALKHAGADVTASLPGSPLAGLFVGHATARRRVYFGYAGAALLVSIGPDIGVAGLLTGHDLILMSAIVTLATSVLLKIGTALGFIAASNTTK